MTDEPAPISASLRPSPRGLIGAWLLAIYDESQRRNAKRRERVLRYDDLREALTKPPLNYPRAEMWNGYVPPKYEAYVEPEVLHDPMGLPNAARIRARTSSTNETPERAVLVVICADAYQRDVEAGLASAEREPDVLELFEFPHPGMPRGDRYDQPAPPASLDDVAHDQADPPEHENADRAHTPMRGPGRQ